ncbi:MAG: hypothetical protein Kow00122_11390 [Thermoleophilia bacterium]
MDAILLVLDSGTQWNPFTATGICTSSSAHSRSQEWQRAGVFSDFWREGLFEHDEVAGIDWDFLSCDRAMTKAPRGSKTGRDPSDRPKKGRNARSSPKGPGCR